MKITKLTIQLDDGEAIDFSYNEELESLIISSEDLLDIPLEIRDKANSLATSILKPNYD